ncbi:MAG: cytochrome c3 family protein [Candidatus Neomarinimicrobiota bacterium]
MKLTKLIISWLAITVSVFAQNEAVSCAGCHQELDQPLNAPVELFADDVHSVAGFNCTICHGGDPEAWDYDEAKSEKAGFIGVPAGVGIIEVCSKCHSNPQFMRTYNPNMPTDQEAKYWTSGHGASLKQGNVDMATCVSCHDVHGIRKKNDPAASVYHANVDITCGRCHSDRQLMGKYGLPFESVGQYRASVHGIALLEKGDLAAPTCNNCHGNHGAAPPALGSIQEVCGTCHVKNQALFNGTVMHTVFLENDIHGCAACHTAHAIIHPSEAMIGVAAPGICGSCHADGDPGAQIGDGIKAALNELNDELEAAETAVKLAEQQGLETENLIFDIQNGHTSLVQSRTTVHSFDLDQVTESTGPGLAIARAVILGVDELIADFRWRRIGLGIATIMISFLAIVLYLYIRAIEKKPN